MTQIATTIEQSERLLKAGLCKECADMQWTYLRSEDTYWLQVAREDSQLFADFPAWSLSKLIDIAGGVIACDADSSASQIEELVKAIAFLVPNGDIDKKYLK